MRVPRCLALVAATLVSTLMSQTASGLQPRDRRPVRAGARHLRPCSSSPILTRRWTAIAPAQAPVRPLEGALVLAGRGEVPDCVLDAFLHLCDAPAPTVAVVSTGGKSDSRERWRERGASSVVVVGRRYKSAKALTLALLGVDGIWFDDGAEPLCRDPLFASLVRDVLARGGVVGGAGAGALAVARPARGRRPRGLGLLPGSRVRLLEDAASASSTSGSGSIVKPGDGLVGWRIPRETALVIHHGRRVAAFGEGDIVASVAGTKEWPERKESIEGVDVFEYGDRPAYGLDFLAWRRSALQRTGPLFPPKTAPRTDLPAGTLILSGGGGVSEETWKRFIGAAGGKDARFVCIPSAATPRPGRKPTSYGAGRLRDLGCKNVVVLHAPDAEHADHDERLLAPLEKAAGVWIDGGRTFRFMDVFEHTRGHALIREVLARGGVVGGSSAGCQVAGDFLVRGDPRTNRRLVFEGYTTGLALVRGVIIDAHFRQRDRQGPFAELMQRYPQMLGIGIDEDTSLVVHGSRGEVVGSNAVSFYDQSAGSGPVLLRAGESYDLAERRRLH